MMNADLYALGLTELWPLVLGVVLPPFISLVNQRKWTPGTKTGVMLAMVFLTTLVGEVISGRLTEPHGWRAYIQSVFVVFLLTVTTYRHVWKPTGVAPRIETATSPSDHGIVDEGEKGEPELDPEEAQAELEVSNDSYSQVDEVADRFNQTGELSIEGVAPEEIANTKLRRAAD